MEEATTILSELAYRQVGEWSLRSDAVYDNPFGDVVFVGAFEGPTGQRLVVPGFYDGGGVWRVRFSPNAVGD